jgi:uncharacterized protein YutD
MVGSYRYELFRVRGYLIYSHRTELSEVKLSVLSTFDAELFCFYTVRLRLKIHCFSPDLIRSYP